MLSRFSQELRRLNRPSPVMRSSRTLSLKRHWQRSCPKGTQLHVRASQSNTQTASGLGPSTSRPRNTSKSGHRFHARKSVLTCGTSLRDRTVDLLLTMARCSVLPSQVDELTCDNTSTHRHSQAPDQPGERHLPLNLTLTFILARRSRPSRCASKRSSNMLDAAPSFTVTRGSHYRLLPMLNCVEAPADS